MELKLPVEMLDNLKKITMYCDGACHAVNSDHPSVAATFNSISTGLQKIIIVIEKENGLIPDNEQQPHQ